jgi:hypothetical protein
MAPPRSASKSAGRSRFDWNDLGRYKAAGRFLDGYPPDVRTFYSPVDDVHGVLSSLLASTQKSIVLNMYGYDHDELTVHNNAVIAAETRAELDRNHDAMLKQMASSLPH